MSAEALLLSAIVDEGVTALRQVYAAGINADHFQVYDEEFQWVERRAARKKPVSLRALKEQFDDFDYQRAKGETIADLADELRREVALAEMNEIISSLAEQTNKDNVLENMAEARERITAVTRAHSPLADVDLDDYEHVLEEMKQGRLLSRQGMSLGILTGIPQIDYYMGGLMPGQFVMAQGRTGSGKSYFLMKLGWAARKQGFNVGLFSPEFNDHEVRCRYHTLASADKDVQEACDLKRSFRNSLLMKRSTEFSLTNYKRMLEYLHEMPGSYHLLCGAGARDQMSVGYIEDRLVEYQLDLVLIDPVYLLKPVRLHREGNVYQEVAWIGEKLHQLSEQYQVPILFTNQSHLEGNKGDAPNMKDSFGAKSLLHISDWVLAVQHMSEENKLVVKANKGRFGETFRFTATFVADSGFFELETPPPTGYRNGHDKKRSEEVVKRVTGRKKAVVKGGRKR